MLRLIDISRNLELLMFGLLLETERCLDGVDLTESHFRPRTNRREPLRLITADLADPVVLQFLNAHFKANGDLVAFISKYTTGSLVGEGGDFAHPGLIMRWANFLHEMLLAAGGDEPIDALIQMTKDTPINLNPMFHLEGGKPRMLLRCTDLPMFMQMEIAMIALEGAKLVNCEQCRNFFLTGPLTGRRSDATFCSDRCRVAAMRARKKGSK
jgi:hypothetical protein